mmetsp:Transcript_29028/g.53116  ORF Transcript_29028/g.53116 Transcript_29028/m.53116 type:complete len:400 (-) Transcript_29028:293-1492(-)|eukprot:CAMPEP_0198285968 /NCGR_PEP_ID=MMETSP1449-20131203/5172_1 /TAXON_ID=420275 /ORGANISM="Attheya septentrionalis, Strain CCMP2084" /LENGTH=399 /DNA_ID=CAMNT_0043983587 /DNA_START=196 /DNA_END=1395 /DNA_ORIENTATION=-
MRVTVLVVAILAFDIQATGFLVNWSTTSFGVNPSFASTTRLRKSVEEADEVPAISELARNIKKKENHDLYFENTSFDGTRPESAFLLAYDNIIRQGSNIAKDVAESVGITGKSYIPRSQMPPECLGFSLDDEAVREAEREREALPGGKVVTNIVSQKLYDLGCFALDELFPGRPIARFWFLEVIARMPYFSYVSMLHLYESFGWWREPELRKIHNAQEYNELHHLLIMESLGGNVRWRDRFLGSHVAIGYYWAVNALFFFSPKAAYEFMELLESHAVDTYTTFLKENEERLKKLPAPRVATSYYKADDLYLFDDFQVSKTPKSRRPPCDTLYDVFKNIAEDEAEHVKTMQACKDYAAVGDIVVSPHLNAADSVISEEQRKAWLDWSEEINRASTGEEDF